MAKSVSEVCSLTYSGAGGNPEVPLAQVAGETQDISEYLDFGFYDRVWFHENASLEPKLPGRWLGISHRTGRLICFFILKSNEQVLSHSLVQRITNLELETENNKAIFAEYDKSIAQRFKEDPKKYDGDKLDMEYWAHFADDPGFVEEF